MSEANGAKLLNGSLLPIINIIGIFVGFGVLWGVQTSRLDDLKEQHASFVAASQAQQATIAARLDQDEKVLNEYRVLLSNRLTSLESDVKYISQMLQEIRLTLKKN